MRTILLHSILLCLFIGNIAEAGTRWLPSTEYLPPEELGPLLREWDKAMSSSDFYARDRQLPSVTGMVPDSERFSRLFYCRFSNPEIIDRVVDFFKKEEAREVAGELPPTEGSAEYMMALAEVAESTFDPRLHDNILRCKTGFSSGFRKVYLAAVNPERTLEYFFSESFERTKGVSYEEFAILSNMTVESPHALRNNRERAIAFVAKHGRYYANPFRDYIRRGRMKYKFRQDYYTRSDALDVLELVGTVTEVPLVEEIIHDTKEVKFNQVKGAWGRRLDTYLDRGYEQIQDKGRRIIEILRQRSPSQR